VYRMNSPASMRSHSRSISKIRHMCSGQTRILRILEVETVMPILADLSQAVAAYRSGHMSLDEFEDRFRTSSRRMFAEGQSVVEICAAVEAALSRFHFEGLDEDGLKAEMATIEIPFAPPQVYVMASYAANANLDSSLMPTLGSNATSAMNHVNFSISA